MKITIKVNGETTIYPYNLNKRSNQITSRGDLDNKGYCRVAYSSTETNEFEFDGAEDFKRKFLPCVEPELLKFMGVKNDKTTSKSPSRK